MKITQQHQFAAPADRVIAMLADQRFALARARASGATRCDALVDGSADGEFTVSIRREVPATTIPSELRSFVGRSLDVKYVEAWEAPDGDVRVGTFAVEISGAPGHVGGALELRPSGGGTEFFATGNVTAPVPLIGAMIEKAVADAVTRAFEAELAAADDWLASA